MARDLKLEVELGLIDKALAPIKAITQGSSKLAKQLKASRDQMKELNQQQRDISAFRTANIEITKQTRAMRDLQTKMRGHTEALEQQRRAHVNLKGNLKAAQTQYNKLSKALIDGKGTTAEFHRELEKAQIKLQSSQQAFTRSTAAIKKYQDRVRGTDTQLEQLKRQQDASKTSLGSLKTKLEQAGISTDGLGKKARALRSDQARLNDVLEQQKARLAAVTRQQERMAKARNAYGKSQQLAGSMAASGAGGLATSYALSRPVSAALNAFAPAENAQTQLKVSMMGADGGVAEEFQQITDLATKLGDRLPGTTADFQNMMTMLKRQGLSATSILGGTGEAAAYLAVQLEMPVVEAAEFAAKMQDATRASEKDMMGLMDAIQRTFYLGVDSSNMLQGFSKLAPVMGVVKKEGLAFTDMMTPLLVMMDQTGMAGESAGNALRKVFQAGLDMKKVDKANASLEKLGISLDFTDGKGEFGGMDALFKQLEKLKGLTSVQRTSVMKMLFGDDAETLQVVNTMMSKGVDGYREVADKMKTQADLQKRVNEQLGTLTNVTEAAQGSWTNAMGEIGATVAPELKDVIKTLGELANKLGAWVREHPELTKQIFKTVAGLALLIAGGASLALTLASILGPIAMLRYGMALFGAASTAALWPILAVIAAVTALAAGAYLVYRNWDTVGPYFEGLVSWISGVFRNGTAQIIGFFTAAFSQIAGFYQSVMDEMKTAVSGGLTGVGSLILNWSPLGLFYSAFAGVMGYLGVELPGKFTEFGGMLMQGLVNGIKNMAGAVKGAVVGAADSSIDWFKEKLGIHSPSRVFAELGGYTMAGLAQGIAGGEGGPLKQLAGTAKRLTASGAMAFAAIPALADQPLSFDNRPPIAARNPASAQGGVASITVHIHAAPGQDANAIARAVAAELDKRERERGARARSSLFDQD